MSNQSKNQNIVELLHAQAFKAFDERNFKKAISLWKKAIKKCKKINDGELLGKLYLGLGMGYAQDGEFASALTNFQQALEIYRKIKNLLKQTHSLYFIGKMYLKLNNYEIANKNYNNALRIAQQIKNQELQADVLFDLGSVAGIQ
ncbi:MAG: tetratricopeptide repeat protein, partial [Candidatus Hodarchaeota archaeon]